MFRIFKLMSVVAALSACSQGMTESPPPGPDLGVSFDLAAPAPDLAGPAPGTWATSASSSLGVASVSAVAVNAQGESFVVGTSFGTLKFEGFTVQQQGASANFSFIAKLSASGKVLWATRTSGLASRAHLAPAADGGVFVSADVSFMGDPQNSIRVQIARFSKEGYPVWERNFSPASSLMTQSGIAIDSDGNLIVGGSFQGSLNDGQRTVTTNGRSALFLTKLDPSGTALSTKTIPAANGDLLAQTFSMLPGGEMVLGFEFMGTVDFGSGAVTAKGVRDIGFQRVRADGSLVWTQLFNSDGLERARRAVATADGDLIATGLFSPSTNFGGGDIPSVGSEDLFVMRLAGTTGKPRWTKTFGSTMQEEDRALALDSAGDIVLSAITKGDIDFGGGVLTTSTPERNNVLVRLRAGTGAYMDAQAFSDPNKLFIDGLARSGDEVVMSGNYYKAQVLKGLSLPSPTPSEMSTAGFVAKLRL